MRFLADIEVAGFLINLDRSPDRLAAAARQLDDAGLVWSRVRAVDGQSLGPDIWSHVDKRSFERNVGRRISAGEVAIYLSHSLAIAAFQCSSARFGLILEDDFFVRDGRAFVQMLEALARNADRWDIVKLSGARRHPLPVRQLTLTDKYVLGAPLCKTTGNAAYLMNQRAAAIVQRALRPFQDHFDHQFDQPWRYGLRYRVVYPFPVLENRAFRHTVDYRHRAAKFPNFQRRHTLYYRVRVGLRRLAYNARHGFFLGVGA
jgi:glycosyl transferase, family 25